MAAQISVLSPRALSMPHCGGLVYSLLAALLTTLAGCSDSTEDPSPDASAPDQRDDDAGIAGGDDAGTSRAVSFARDLQPLFNQRCVFCHYTGTGFDLSRPFDPDEGLIGLKNGWYVEHDSPYEFVVVPGDPDNSFLVYKLAASPDPVDFDVTNNGEPMPYRIPRLTADELMWVRQWVEDGAENDAFFKEKVAPIFGTEITLGRKRGKCTLCHYPDSPTGLSVLDVFDPESGLVGVDANLSTKLRVDPGNPDNSFLIEKLEEAEPSAGAQMPLHPPRFSEAEVAMVRTWISDGAHDD